MTRFRLNRLEPFFFLAAMLAVLSGAGGEYLAAQSGRTSSTDGSTPLGLNPGAPLGSFPLSGIENINLYNGNLNFRLPLLQLTGRGDARMAVTLPIEMKWRVEHITVPNPPYGESTHYYYPVPDWWGKRNDFHPLFSFPLCVDLSPARNFSLRFAENWRDVENISTATNPALPYSLTYEIEQASVWIRESYFSPEQGSFRRHDCESIKGVSN